MKVEVEQYSYCKRCNRAGQKLFDCIGVAGRLQAYGEKCFFEGSAPPGELYRWQCENHNRLTAENKMPPSVEMKVKTEEKK